MIFSNDKIAELRDRVRDRLSAKRFAHVLAVEDCAAKLGRYMLPSRVNELRVAALLHDISKELPTEEHIRLLIEDGFALTDEDRASAPILHSFTAPIIVKRDFSNFATPDVLSAVFKHTVGDSDMSIFDKIIFISDYVELTRSYNSCIMVRNFLFDNFDRLNEAEREKRLNESCIASIDGALDALSRSKSVINPRMLMTKKSLLD